MKTAARMLRWLGAALGLLIVALLGGFGLLQTEAGLAGRRGHGQLRTTPVSAA